VTKRTRNQQSPRQVSAAGRAGTGLAPVAGSTRLREAQRARSPLERYRGRLLGIGVIAVVLVVGGFLFLGATSPAYACTTTLQIGRAHV